MNDKEESKETIERRAYIIGIQYKNQGLSQDVIYARLEKQGFPVELAEQVAQDVNIERPLLSWFTNTIIKFNQTHFTSILHF